MHTLIRVLRYPYKGVQGLHACPKGVQALHALQTGVQALHACLARLLAMCTPIVGVHMACSMLGMACSPCTPFQRGVQRLQAVFIRRAHALRACRYQAPATTSQYAPIEVKANYLKANDEAISYIVSRINE
ncbi:hypothetical protein PCANC_23901 [Puccinia coronata f. sp. avenae]|uniref:Uncharacterized protein n=1 Tax=Puccinia coronata f. sp. avenae TaxID=200324 RepID=A0A2N5U081_9BASI|nr:hypothetical protein PCANC_23901 [Puccinia coronata f. sp. avenae]